MPTIRSRPQTHERCGFAGQASPFAIYRDFFQNQWYDKGENSQ